MSGQPQGKAMWQCGGVVGEKTGATLLRWGNRSTEHIHGAKQLRPRQRWNPPPTPSSRVLWVSHSPSASGWSDTQGCDPPARGLPGALCRPDPPREGSSPAELPAHPPARCRPRLQGARSAASSPTPAALAPTRTPGTFVSRGDFPPLPLPPPRGATSLPGSPDPQRTPAPATGAPPPRSPNQLGTPAAHAARGHSTDTVPTRAAR